MASRISWTRSSRNTIAYMNCELKGQYDQSCWYRYSASASGAALDGEIETWSKIPASRVRRPDTYLARRSEFVRSDRKSAVFGALSRDRRSRCWHTIEVVPIWRMQTCLDQVLALRFLNQWLELSGGGGENSWWMVGGLRESRMGVVRVLVTKGYLV